MKNLFAVLKLVAAGVGLAALGAASVAHARDNVYWSVGIDAAPGVTVGVGNARPVYVQPPMYVQPAPVYVQPQPVYQNDSQPVYQHYSNAVNPRHYVQPAPVYLQPAPIYYAPAPVLHSGYGYHDAPRHRGGHHAKPHHERSRGHGHGHGHGYGYGQGHYR